jgi:predicted pyridoxine 5'-phosphate oxidase superfamily flavin-nucleotide-binding protein
MTMSHPSDVAFTPSVKAVQERKGSRPAYARIEQRGGWQSRITPDLAQFIAAQTSVFLATANADGQPYIQHRGGPPGFLRVVDEKTIAFADFAGNRQYITVGRLAENDAVSLFLIDYAERTRVKVWGRARVVENDPRLLGKLTDPAYKARVERAIVIGIDAWDINCRQHIPRKFAAADVEAAREGLEMRIRELEAENARLKAGG